MHAGAAARHCHHSEHLIFGTTVSKSKQPGKVTGEINADPNPLLFRQGCVVISWKTTDPAGGEVRVSTSSGHEKLVSKTKKQSGQAEISWITGSTIYEFRLYGASAPDTLIDSVRVRRDLNAASKALQELADEALQGNVDMAEISRFIAAVIPAYLQTDRFGQLFPVLLRELATEVMYEKIGAPELCQFIATVTPKYLNNSIAGKIIATPNPVPFGADVSISWGINDPAGGEVRLLTSSSDETLISRQPSGQIKIPWISGSMVHEFRLYATSQPDAPIDS